MTIAIDALRALAVTWRALEQEGPAYTACTIGKCADEMEAILDSDAFRAMERDALCLDRLRGERDTLISDAQSEFQRAETESRRADKALDLLARSRGLLDVGLSSILTMPGVTEEAIDGAKALLADIDAMLERGRPAGPD